MVLHLVRKLKKQAFLLFEKNFLKNFTLFYKKVQFYDILYTRKEVKGYGL